MAARPRILFVEDEASIAEPFANALRRDGFEPVLARTGAEALARAEHQPPDLVLLDLNLPDVDGRDVARELRRTSDVPSTIEGCVLMGVVTPKRRAISATEAKPTSCPSFAATVLSE